MLRQTQGNPFEKHARPSGGGRQPPVWTWFAQGDAGPKRPARNTWLQDGAPATAGAGAVLDWLGAAALSTHCSSVCVTSIAQRTGHGLGA